MSSTKWPSVLIGALFVFNIAATIWLFRFGIHRHAIVFPLQKDTPWWSQIGPEVTALGGIIALWTYLGNKRQQREQFELKSMQDEHHDVLDRLADESPLMRATAANRLADLAQRLRPGVPEEAIRKRGGKIKFYDPWTYPLLETSAAQLCATLTIEQHQDVLRETVGALGRIINQAYDPQLLRFLIDLIAGANKKAFAEFVTLVAEYRASVESAPVAIEYYSPVCDDVAIVSIVLKFLRISPPYAAAFTAKLLDIEANGIPDQSVLQTQLKDIRQAAIRVRHCRDVLALALRMPSPLLPNGWRSELQRINLNHCCLAGANLNGAYFVNARLIGTHLEGADLRRTDFREADLRDSILCYTDMYRANLEDAILDGANLYYAQLISANLTNTHLAETNWGRPDINANEGDWAVPNFHDTAWWKADFALKETTESFNYGMVRRINEVYPVPSDDLLPGGEKMKLVVKGNWAEADDIAWSVIDSKGEL